MTTHAPSGSVPARRRPLAPARALALAFLVAIGVGTVLLRLPMAHADGYEHGWATALFTATSALCVTGLVVVDTGSAWSPFGQAVIALLIKVGGLGILTLGAAVALATGRRMGFDERRRLQLQTSAARVGGVVRFVRRLVVYTGAVELVGALALWPRFAHDEGVWRGAWTALFHAVSAFNNAGFGLYADSLARYVTDPWVTGVIALLFVLGGLGLVVVVDLALRAGLGGDPARRRRLTLHSRLALVTAFVLAVSGSLALGALEWRNPATLGALPVEARPGAALFAALTPRTAGFSTIEPAEMHHASAFVTIGLMLVGGNPGSTAGGLKTTTVAVLVLAALAAARGRSRVTAFGRTIGTGTITKAAVLAMLASLTIGLASTLLALSEPEAEPLALVFEAVSAFATVGLSLGVTPELSLVGQLVVVVLMVLGRVGLLTVALALATGAAPPRGRYPIEDVVVG